MSLTICNSILKIKDQLGAAFSGAELVFSPRKSQVNSADSLYISRPKFNTASPGIVIQAITYISKSPSPLTPVTITYTAGATAGSEVVTVTGTDISIQIEDTVSTANQILAAIALVPAAVVLINSILSGTGTATQTIVSITSLSDEYCYLPLAETTTNAQLCVFELNWDDAGNNSGSIIFDPIQIPNQTFLDLSTILTISRG